MNRLIAIWLLALCLGILTILYINQPTASSNSCQLSTPMYPVRGCQK